MDSKQFPKAQGIITKAVTTIVNTEGTQYFFPHWFHFPVLKRFFLFHNVAKINKANYILTSRYINALRCHVM